MNVGQLYPIRPEAPRNHLILGLLNLTLAGEPLLRHYWWDLVRLPAGSLPEAFLPIFRRIRDTGVLHDDIGLYLIARQVKQITEYRLAEKAESPKGSDSSTVSSSSTSAQAGKVGAVSLDPSRVFADTFRECGEEPLAERYENDLADFQRAYTDGFRRLCQGSLQFSGSHIPGPWIEDLLDAALSGAASDHSDIELEASLAEDDGLPTIVIDFVPSVCTEGHHAGEHPRRVSAVVDCKAVIDQFTQIESVSWQAMPFSYMHTVCVRIVGLYYNERVAVRIEYMPYPIALEAVSDREPSLEEVTHEESG